VEDIERVRRARELEVQHALTRNRPELLHEGAGVGRRNEVVGASLHDEEGHATGGDELDR
jgi:hypothetical protein